jgi:hypothetical protein
MNVVEPLANRRIVESRRVRLEGAPVLGVGPGLVLQQVAQDLAHAALSSKRAGAQGRSLA